MPVIRGQYYSNYRLSKMLQSREEAIELRGWDRFCELTGIFGKGLQKKQQLRNLYNQLHHEIESDDNIKRLITFNQMRKLVNDNDNPNPVEFRVELQRLNGLSLDISYKIGNYTLLTKPCMPLEEQVISELRRKNHIDNEGTLGKLADNLEETTITFIDENSLRNQEFINTRIPFGLPNISGNDCFINSAIQFILNNEALIKACTNHPNKDFSQGVKKLVDGDLSHYKNLIKIIRHTYTDSGNSGQDSAPMVLQRLFAHNPHILLIKKTSEEELFLEQYDVFQNLDNFIDDNHLLRIINDFPTEVVEDSGNTRCLAYETLKAFVFRNSNLTKFTILFDYINFLEFKEFLKDQHQLSLLKELIEHRIFQDKLNKLSEFTWIDSSGFGFKYYRYGNYVREKFIVYSQIPDNNNLNTIIVHSGTVNSGHYVCYVKKENNWFLCNDSQITKVPDIEKSIGNKNIVAYNYKVENKPEKIHLRYQDPFYWKLEPQCDIED
jgi:hypothetical protein